MAGSFLTTSGTGANDKDMDKPCPIGAKSIAEADRRPKNIREYLQYVNHTHPGGFRALRLSLLKKGTQDEKDTKMADAEDEEEKREPSKNPIDVKRDVMAQIDSAYYSSLFALDLVSLLLTKESPSAAGLTLRPELRDMVGIGTLGSQFHAESNVTPERARELSSIANGWNVLAIREVRDSTSRTATTLEKEVDMESKYWEDVLSVREEGWSMCRMPRERQTLGVRFGFNESNPEFRNMSLAPMRRAKDGSVQLDLGIVGGQTQRLVVTIERDGKVVGVSSVDAAAVNGTGHSLSAQVLEARNTIFARELWHELQMESRLLLSYHVKQYEKSIEYTGDYGLVIKLELLSPSTTEPAPEALPENLLAESIRITLYLLLGHYHRQQESVRSRPAPPSQPRSKAQTPCHLLRPIIRRIIQMDAIEECTRYMGQLVQSLKTSKVADSKFELVTATLPKEDIVKAGLGMGQMSSSQAFFFQGILVGAARFAIDLTILPGHRLSIIGQTYLTPATTTLYQVNLLPSPQADHPNTLTEICPPYRDYPTFAELRDYINRAVACALASHSQKVIEQGERAKLERAPPPGHYNEEVSEAERWHKSVIGTSLSTSGGNRKSIRFEIACSGGSPQLTVASQTSDSTLETCVWNAGGSSANISLPDILADLVKGPSR